MNSPIVPDPTSGEALAKAARLIPAHDPGALLFHEEREDLRIELRGSSGSPCITLTSTQGTCVQGTNGHLTHRSDPQPDGLEALPRLLDVDRTLSQVLDLARQVQSVGSGIVTDLSVFWVEFIQTVWVAQDGLPFKSDVRRSQRLKVSAFANGWNRTAVATMERVFRPDSTRILEGIAEPLVRRLRQRLTARPAPTGSHPIVFAPGTGGIVAHELVGHALEADTILRRGSLLSKAEGRIAGPLVTVMDDPRRGRAAWRMDDEGEEPIAVALLREGRVCGAIHDRASARAMKRGSTGHGRRATYATEILPRLGCTFLTPGPHDSREVIESTHAGVHVRRMESAGTDPSTGTAFFRVTDADWIEGGRIEAPLGAFLLRMRLPEALASIDRVADDLEFDRCVGSCVRDGQALATSVGAPTFRLGVATIIR